MGSIYSRGGKVGVNLFVLISGYFLIELNHISISKIIKLWLQVFTYSVFFYLLFVCFDIQPFSYKELIKCIFPITFYEWWFASTYFVLYLLSPYINRLLNSFTKKEYSRFLTLLTVIWCVIRTLTTKSWGSNDLLWFVYLYSLAGYIKLHSNIQAQKRSIYFLISFVLAALTFLSVVVFDAFGTRYAFFGEHATYFYGMDKLPILLISVTFFIGFISMNINYSKLINTIGQTTFGIYLIHENVFVRPFVWKTIFKNVTYAESIYLIPYSLLVIVSVFVACMLFEIIRINILEKNYMKLVQVLLEKYKKHLF